jgi:type I restriction enzyme S subunit
MEVKPGYKQTEVGVIPEAWEVRNIGQMFRLINGCAFKPEDWKQNGTPIIRIQNLNDPSAEFNYSQAPVPERNRVEAGDLLFAWSGTLGSSFGARVWNGPSGVLNQHIFKVHMNEQQITLPFSMLVFARVEEDIAKQAHGFKASFVHVKKSDLVKVELPLPPLPEQRAIAEALSDVDGLLGGLDRLIAKKRDLKQAAMQQLLTGQTRLPGFHGEWEVKRLGEVLKVRHGKSQHGIAAPDGKYAILASGGEIGRTNAFIYDQPSVLIGRKGTIDAPQYVDTPFWTVDTLFFTEISSEADAKFVFYKFTMIRWRSYNEASGVPSLNAKTIENIEVTMPPLAEQTAIAEVLSEMDGELAVLEQRREKTRALKQAMMQELLTGRTRLI